MRDKKNKRKTIKLKTSLGMLTLEQTGNELYCHKCLIKDDDYRRYFRSKARKYAEKHNLTLVD
jgi:hypothetical protein